MKDLRIINRDLSKMVLVDNAAYSYGFQIDNGIPIIPYYEGKEDCELLMLKYYLSKLKTAEDVRDINRETFRLRNYPEYDSADTAGDSNVDSMIGFCMDKDPLNRNVF